MADHEPRRRPTIDKWVEKPAGRYSIWDDLVEEVLAQPGAEWARLERPEPWNSAFPAWFRKKYKNVELYVPPAAPKGLDDGKRYMFMRRKPLAPSPVDKR